MTSAVTTAPAPRRLAMSVAASVFLHVVLVSLIVFDVAGIGAGFGLGSGPGFGLGAGGGLGLGQTKRREIFSLTDLPEPVPPRDPTRDQALKELLAPTRPDAIA